MLQIINWYDWVTPTTPTSAIITGAVFSILIAFIVWFEQRELKIFFAFSGIGVGVTLLVTGLLDMIGFFK